MRAQPATSEERRPQRHTAAQLGTKPVSRGHAGQRQPLRGLPAGPIRAPDAGTLRARTRRAGGDPARRGRHGELPAGRRTGARPVALDLSHRQLQHALRIGGGVPLVEADAGALPFADGSFDLACSAYGALPFVADPVRVLKEVHRVLRPGGRFVFSVTHPIRWAFPDEPGPEGLSVSSSYFDRTPYVEQDEEGHAVYVEHHRTVGDRVRDVVAGGFRLLDLVEPQWPAWNTQEWGGWSPLRGNLIPGTAIFVCVRD
ncbi:class I SAM-dependent methyltransferase [Streptomyces sp. RLA2-12]|uniref:class I SAM-dependent methyltransferase n=1 Tax=Streptomyces sp. RLA2-12 TaxID=2721242 RepID=UPI0037DCFAC1